MRFGALSMMDFSFKNELKKYEKYDFIALIFQAQIEKRTLRELLVGCSYVVGECQNTFSVGLSVG